MWLQINQYWTGLKCVSYSFTQVKTQLHETLKILTIGQKFVWMSDINTLNRARKYWVSLYWSSGLEWHHFTPKFCNLTYKLSSAAVLLIYSFCFCSPITFNHPLINVASCRILVCPRMTSNKSVFNWTQVCQFLCYSS